MQMIELLERYGIKTRSTSGLGYGEGSRTPSCHNCFEEGHKPFRDVTIKTFFVDMNPMHKIWSKLLNQPFKDSAENVNFFCGVHYLSFVLRHCNDTLEMVHQYMNPSGEP